MINELIVHLGDTKTGSTSIQKVLAQKTYEVPGQTLCYPTKNNHIALAKTLTQKPRFKERETRFSRIHQAFQESDADYGIISAEHFQSVDPRMLNETIETYWPELRDRLRLVSYVRPHAGKFLSAFSERVKLGADLASVEGLFETMSAKELLDYTPRFEAGRKVFGSALSVRPFVRDRLYKGDVVQDFFKYFLNSDAFEITGDTAANPSLTDSQLALLRVIHRQMESKAKGRKGSHFRNMQGKFGRAVSEYLRVNGIGNDGEKLRMPAGMFARFQERYAPDAEAMDQGFFEGFPFSNDLENAGQETVGEAQSLEAADYFSAAEIADVLRYTDSLAATMMKKRFAAQQAAD